MANRSNDDAAGPSPLPPPAWGDDARPSRAEWVLVLDGGETIRLTADSVVLGRASRPAGEEVEVVALPDPTRTLSKVHARLDRAGDAWTITDLGSTNGVVIGDGAEEHVLGAGESAVVSGRFLLGELGVRLERVGG